MWREGAGRQKDEPGRVDLPAAPKAHASYVAEAGDRFRAAYAGVAKAVTRTFPGARPVFEHGMPAWLIARPEAAPKPGRAGTIPSDRVFVGLVERKGGITVHLWYPGDYDLLDKHRDELARAGLEVMRGCLVFNRKQEFPVAPIEGLLHHIRRSDEAAPRKG